MLVAAFAALLVAAPAASACSTSAEAYLDSFLDDSCLSSPLPANNVELDAAGGLRLTTSSATQTKLWDTEAADQFGTSFGTNTLKLTGASTAAALELGDTDLPLLRDPVNVLADLGDNGFLAGLASPASTVPDNDNVDDPAVVKVASAYVMYYSGTAEDGSGPAIFRATSPDGVNWTKSDPNGAGTAPNPQPVLEASATAGAFDERGVFGPDVVHDPGDTSAPYKMWYSGRGDVFTQIGYATSVDGITWTKVDAEPTRPDDGNTTDPDTDPDPDPDLDPVVRVGKAGAADSFAAQEPAVIRDNEVWHMWYTADDSTKKRIAYATSQNGSTWSKGGMVIGTDAAEDGATNPTNANVREGVFAPSVIKSGTSFRIYFGGRKFLSTNPPRFQTRIFTLTSPDGVTWGGGLNEALGASAGTFDAESVTAPEVMPDGGTFRMWYSGNNSTIPATSHQRIGYAQGSETAFTGQAAASGDRCPTTGVTGCVLDIGAPETAFDARQSSGPAVAKPMVSTYVGFYWGVRGSDFKPRLGIATSSDGATWVKAPVTANNATDGGALLALPTGGNPFDGGGHRDPSVVYDVDVGQTDYHLYFTAVKGDGTRSIGYSTSEDDEGQSQRPSTWSAPAQALAPTNNGFDAAGASHPAVVKNGAGNFVMFYSATDDDQNATKSIARVVSTNVDDPDGPWGAKAQVLTATLPYENAGVKDPVVVFDGTTYHMTYTAIEGIEVNGDTKFDIRDQFVERIAYATSADGATWTKKGLVLNPSGQPYAYDETGVGPAGALLDGATLQYYFDGVDRTGRTAPGRATAAVSGGAVTPGKSENGSATYEFTSSTPRDFRKLLRKIAGTGRVELWMSFRQPYDLSGSTPAWSSYFPVIVSDQAEAEAALSFLLTVKSVRWQARLSQPAGSPKLDSVTLEHRDVTFNASGGPVTTDPISPPSGQNVTNWTTATVVSREFPTAGAGGGTVEVLSGDGSQVLATQPLIDNGTTTVDISTLSVTTHPSLRVRFNLTSASPFTTTPLVKSLKVGYFTNVSSGEQQPPPPPDGDGDGVPDASDACPTVAANTPNGCPPPPPPLDVTIAASPALVVFGQTTTLSGKVTRAGAPAAGTAVSLFEQPFGSPAFAAITGATSGATGDWSSVVTPQRNTTYRATVPTGSSEPTVAVQVAQKVLFKASRRGTRGSFSGSVQPAHAAKEVVIQRKTGTGYVTFKKVKTTSTSTFATTAALRACQKYTFRVVSAADADHLQGTSPDVLVERHRVALKVALRGRTASFTGKVAPLHRSGRVVVKEIKGTRAVTIARARLTRRSTFALKKKVTRGRHVYRVDMAADRCHYAGSSARRAVTAR